MQRHSRIFIVGHNDSVENSLLQYFTSRLFTVFSNTKDKIDVLDQAKIGKFFKSAKPQYVFLGSVRSGGILANQKFPAEFIYENLQAQNNVIEAARVNRTKKLLYIGSSCIYPRSDWRPVPEESLLTGPVEKTSEAYAVAKIAGIKMCQAYQGQYGFHAIAAVPATLYGPGSDDDLENAHVMGALIAKFHRAVKQGQKEVVVWGSGRPKREFLYVEDFARACEFLMDRYNGADLVNIGTGGEVSIKKLAGLIARISGFKGKLRFDRSKPDGALRKLLDSGRLAKLGWKPEVALEEGIRKTYQWYEQKGRG